jgi:phosphoglycolate phosphatase-like HAD superfamily hydrolase
VKPGLLVFDLDGTLIPTMEDYADQAAGLMEAAFTTPFAEARAAYFRTSGLPFEQQLRQLYPDHDDTDSVAERFESWKDGYLRGLALGAQVADLLSAWRAEGYLVAISSNNMEHYVERLARDWPVDCALGYRPSDRFAKGEDHFRALEERFGLSRERFVFTGDSPNDARIARAARVQFRALLTDAFALQDFLAVDPQIVILSCLEELGGTLPR